MHRQKLSVHFLTQIIRKSFGYTGTLVCSITFGPPNYANIFKPIIFQIKIEIFIIFKNFSTMENCIFGKKLNCGNT